MDARPHLQYGICYMVHTRLVNEEFCVGGSMEFNMMYIQQIQRILVIDLFI